MNANGDRIEGLKARISDYDARIADLRQQRAELHVKRKALEVLLVPSDDILRSGDQLSESAARRRRDIHAAMLPVKQAIATIDRDESELTTKRRNLQMDLEEALKPPVTMDTLQAAIDSAQTGLTSLMARRPAVVAALASAQHKQAEVTALEHAELQAAESLREARAEAFMAPTPGKKHDAANEAITAADMASMVASEKADTGRAALPRIEALIDQCRSDLETLDAKIHAAHATVSARTLARDLHAARIEWDAATQALVRTGARIKKLDPDTFRRLRDAMPPLA